MVPTPNRSLSERSGLANDFRKVGHAQSFIFQPERLSNNNRSPGDGVAAMAQLVDRFRGRVWCQGEHTWSRNWPRPLDWRCPDRWSPDWLRINPFAKLVSYGTRDDATVRQCVRECSGLLTNVTRTGRRKDEIGYNERTENDRAHATGVSSLDGFAKRKKLTLEQMKMIETMDIANNRLLFRPGVPTIENVEVSRGPGARASTRSFAEPDDLLIEEMHHMILECPD